MKLINFTPPMDAKRAEAEIVAAVKDVLYKFSGVITVAQAIGCLEIAKSEILKDAE